MCGRFSVIDDPLAKQVSDMLGIQFSTKTNTDLRPTQDVATISLLENCIQQQNTIWGIKPSWSKKLLINAQAETVVTKKTFKKAFTERRCVVPCSGWYEWKDEGGPRKQKYLFEHAYGEPLYMAGIWYPHEHNELVTLTINPNEKCAAIHSRMPLFIQTQEIERWLQAEVDGVMPLLVPVDEGMIKIVAVNT